LCGPISLILLPAAPAMCAIDPVGALYPWFTIRFPGVFALPSEPAWLTHCSAWTWPRAVSTHGAWSTHPALTRVTHLHRGALLLSGGMIYIPYGGICRLWGSILAVSSRPRLRWRAAAGLEVPTTREGGIGRPAWASGARRWGCPGDNGHGEAVTGSWITAIRCCGCRPGCQLRDGRTGRVAAENSDDADLGLTGPVVLLAHQA